MRELVARLRPFIVRLTLAAIAVVVALAVTAVATWRGGAHESASAPAPVAVSAVPAAGTPTDGALTGAPAATDPTNGGPAAPDTSAPRAPSPTPRPTPTPTPGSGNLITKAIDGLKDGAGALVTAAIPDWPGTGRVTFLLLGTDRRPGEEASRSDTIMVLSVDPTSRSMALISVPRDLCVGECETARDRVNGIFLREGPEAMARAIGELLNVQIDYYATMGFAGFEQLVDALGGIDLLVYQEFDEYFLVPDSEDRVHLRLEVGENHLDGPTALMYARSRLANPRSDWDRVCRQQQVLLAVKQQALSARALVMAPSLIRTLIASIDTSFPVTDMPPMAKLILSIPPENTVLRVIDHGSGTILGHEGEDGAEMLKPDPEKMSDYVWGILYQAANGLGGYGAGDAIEFTTGGCG
ncbi:MAG: LCP family protein [Chloroflexota bacterium]|nr:LCP family protein [Chloroflexota bacterium]MDP6509341.1 LCP family protein [Chloroflexota bacterium]MDP6756836.1 LCP family protein [Chloroflexota bacterium]